MDDINELTTQAYVRLAKIVKFCYFWSLLCVPWDRLENSLSIHWKYFFFHLEQRCFYLSTAV